MGCSTKKDKFLNRTYHSVSTKYNVLYNGNESLRLGLEELNANFEDNFWEQLPIEPLKIDRLALPGMGADQDSSPEAFENAEEKAVKAVQKHSMVIVRQERNRQIDDAYLLLGKARYYSKRFVPALEAFNYVILNYPDSDLLHETRIWQGKTLVRLQNEEQAIRNLKDLLKEEDVENEDVESAHTALAMAYVALDNQDQVTANLIEATKTHNNKEQTARNLFILGQLYRTKGLIDSSDIAFQTLIDLKKAPYKYVIRARIEKAKNVTDKLDALAVKEELKRLIKDRDNRPYLNELYYQLGEIEKHSDVNLAQEYFEKSLRTNSNNTLQGELSYEALGNLFFDKAEFLKAGAYYDSVINTTQLGNTKRVRRLKRKRNNLNEVIFYEGIVKRHDSILTVVDMNEEERISFFTNHIEELKIQDEKQKTIQKNSSGSGFLNFGKKENSGTGRWYFYNVQAVGFGEQEFKNTWGNRPLEENWRLSDKTQINIMNNASLAADQNLDILDADRYNLDSYLERVPGDRTEIDSLVVDRNNAYFRLGIIYKEQFKEIELATNKLESLLTFQPEEALVVPAKYHLYKIYAENNPEKATTLRSEIIQKYPESNYAKIILDPNQAILDNEKNSPEKEYAEVFYAYKAEELDLVIDWATEAISKYEGNPIIPKFELLRAYALGKKNGAEAFKDALDFVALNYPNTEEGKRALEIIQTIKTKL